MNTNTTNEQLPINFNEFVTEFEKLLITHPVIPNKDIDAANEMLKSVAIKDKSRLTSMKEALASVAL